MRYTATVLSPLHIGQGETLFPTEFFVSRDSVVFFDTAAFLAAQPPARSAAAEALLLAGGPDQTPAMLEAVLTAAEQGTAGFHRYTLPAPEFVRTRLRGEPGGPGAAKAGGPAGKPGASAPAAAAAPRKDLRGGLGGKPSLSLPTLANLPPAPPTAKPDPGRPAPGKPAAAAPAAKEPPKPDGADRPDRPPFEKVVGAFLKHPVGDGIYLPGTAIKGALRTALLFHLLAENPALAEDFGAYLNDRIRDWAYSGRAADADLEGLLAPERGDARLDALAALSLGDTETLPPGKSLSVEMVRVHSPRTGPDGRPIPSDRGPDRGPERGPGGRGGPPPRGGIGGGFGGGRPMDRPPTSFRGAPLFLETVRPKTAFTGQARIDDAFFSPRAKRFLRWPGYLPEVTIPLLCKAANALARRVLAAEADHYHGAGPDFARVQEFHRDLAARLDRAGEDTAYVSVGYGAGWHRITAGLALESMNSLDLIALRKRFALASHRLGARFPKTRRLVMDSFFTPRVPLGWIEVKFGA